MPTADMNPINLAGKKIPILTPCASNAKRKALQTVNAML